MCGKTFDVELWVESKPEGEEEKLRRGNIKEVTGTERMAFTSCSKGLFGDRAEFK